ncbi:MAG: thymidine kinase [Candidatus Onthovivens sp.]|nr:thymidine kinase [Candidatus Onthovivens sp.]MDY4822441.1 thymidine kinase [Candidatus Onthovivens sp.]
MRHEETCIGNIEVITGPMFAGKSEELLRRINRLKYAKKKFLVFKPKIDNRYSDDEVVSHQKRAYKCISISSAHEIYSYLTESLDCVCIDEVQFFDDEIIDIAEYLANKGIRVIVAGLDTDFRGEPFKITANLLARSEDVTKLTAICVKCGKEATRTQRLVNGEPASINDPIVLVGANESYEPRCRKCHCVKK